MYLFDVQFTPFQSWEKYVTPSTCSPNLGGGGGAASMGIEFHLMHLSKLLFSGMAQDKIYLFIYSI